MQMLSECGTTVLTLSLDDYYLSRRRRQTLAHTVHPLFATRGVPGTHDVRALRSAISAAGTGRSFALRRFDKGCDDILPRAQWPVQQQSADAILIEGWCIGARPQAPDALIAPINRLEREEDPLGTWRAHVNAALAGPYHMLFGQIDHLVFLAPPGFSQVLAWRAEQERGNAAAFQSQPGGGVNRLMNPAQLERFIAHYERLSRHIIATMPDYAQTVIAIDAGRRVVDVRHRPAPGAPAPFPFATPRPAG